MTFLQEAEGRQSASKTPPATMVDCASRVVQSWCSSEAAPVLARKGSEKPHEETAMGLDLKGHLKVDNVYSHCRKQDAVDQS